MTKEPQPPESTGSDAPEVREPVAMPTLPSYMCSSPHVDIQPAVEVHGLGDGVIMAYCAECAMHQRPLAHVVLSADLAHALGIKVTNPE